MDYRIAAIKDVLLSEGWGESGAGSSKCIGEKEFDTLDGSVKRALVWISEFKAEGSLMVTGEYYSEGHNVLGATGFIVQNTNTKEQITTMASDFIKDAEFKINESYGRRLRFA